MNNVWNGIKHGRVLSQILFLGLTIWIGYQMLSGVRGATIEKYCPFGGVETLLPWLNKTGTLCSLSTMNISVMGGVLLITFLYKRVFCSHICPVGTLSEWVSALGTRFIVRSWRVPNKVDRALKWLKYVVLVLILWGTYRVGELIFREVDPYYVLFTLGQGHGIDEGVIGIRGYSIFLILALLVLNLFILLAFCRYLCPMAACLNPLSRIGLVRVHRNTESCIDCGKCDMACKWGVRVSTVKSVSDSECSNCQDCVRSCPVPDTLTLNLGRRRS